jgi:alpha-D-ribose 1-methylphosphonate 5-triphosphate diphosphatase
VQTLIQNATLILPDRIIEGGWLLIEDESILDLGEEATCPAVVDRVINAWTQFLLPGLIDLHCDAIEKLVEPRPNVHFDIQLALAEADWRLAGSGITTEFHAISLDDNEFGIRSETFLQDLSQALLRTRGEILVRHKIHARLELTSKRGSEALIEAIEQGMCDMISLMDHSPGQGQFRTEQAFRDYVTHTTNRTPEEIEPLLKMKHNQASEIPKRVERVTQSAREKGLAIATHDDDTAIKVEQWPGFGVALSEFPTTLEAARKAHDLGLAVCMGAPNVLRGKSSSGNLSAREAIHVGVANVLCSDYYPAAMLRAVFLLAMQKVLTLPQAARMVTLNPAQAVGLGKEYGTLERGKVADVILVKLNPLGIPAVQRVFVQGKERLARGT